jgi:predicted flavoprotein YhiN
LFTLQTKYAIETRRADHGVGDDDSEKENKFRETRGLLHGLSGLSVPMARVSFVPYVQDDDDDSASSSTMTPNAKDDGTKRKKTSAKKKTPVLQQEGPLLITHRGLSGPAILRLSAFGALEFHQAKYRGELRIHWAPLASLLGGSSSNNHNVEEVAQVLWQQTTLRPKKTILSACPLFIESATTTATATDTSSATAAIPRRLWASLALAAGVAEDQVWASCSKKLVRQLATLVADCRIPVTGKDVFKEEFVTAGGVDLKEVDMRTMQSKRCPGLYFCGEVLNVDGVTGGFNFLNCWSTGHVAGVHAASTSSSSSPSLPTSMTPQ